MIIIVIIYYIWYYMYDGWDIFDSVNYIKWSRLSYSSLKTFLAHTFFTKTFEAYKDNIYHQDDHED